VKLLSGKLRGVAASNMGMHLHKTGHTLFPKQLIVLRVIEQLLIKLEDELV
jgi:hypothetical protein